MEFEGRAPIKQQLGIAPLIDVMLLLLVFFMLTSTFYTSEAVDLQLPDSNSAVVADELPLVVTVAKDGSIQLNGTSVSLEDLQSRLSRQFADDPERAVTLKTDAELSVQIMVHVMDGIRNAGGKKISLATEDK